MTTGNGYRLRRSRAGAGGRCLLEDVPLGGAIFRIRRSYDREDIFVEKPNPAANRCSAPTRDIPGKADLWREVRFRVSDAIAQPGDQGVELWNWRKLTIAASRLPGIADAIGERQIPLPL